MKNIRFLIPAKVGYFCILLFLHTFLCNIERLDATAFSNFNLDTNWDTYLCANENPIVDEKTVILTATGLPTSYLPCLGLRKNLKISGAYQMSSQLINVGPPRGEHNFGLAFNAIDENNYDFVYLSYDNADSCTKLTYGYVEKESLTKFSTKSDCMNIRLNEWNFLKITVKDNCDHCDNVDGYVNGQRVFSFEAHFATRGFGGALAENGFSNVVEFREFDIGPIIPSLAPVAAKNNIAFQRPVTASSTDYASSVDNAVDGEIDENGRYSSNMCLHTKKEPSFVTIDLGGSYEISEMKVAGRSEECRNCREQTQGWVIRVGNSGTENDAVCKSNIDAFGGELVSIKCDTKVEGRYVTVYHSTWMVLCEIEVYSQNEG